MKNTKALWKKSSGARMAIFCISVAADGRAKIWALNRFRCIWTSERKAGVVDPCVKVAEDLTHGVLAVATRSGEVVIHSGFNADLLQVPDPAQPAIAETRISPPLIPSSNPLQPSEIEKPEVSALFIDTSRAGVTSILVSYLNNPWFYRYSIRSGATAIHTTVFGDTACGPIRCVLPSFSTGPGESSFIVAGDSSGGISFYDWNMTSTSDAPILPVRRLEMFPDAFPACLAMNSVMLAVGSSRGTIRVLDAVNFDPLRSIAACTHDEVRKILLERQMLVASFGNRVLSWKAALPDPAGTGKKGKGKRESNAKWQRTSSYPFIIIVEQPLIFASSTDQIELRCNIAESRDELASEAEYTRRTFGREREQLSELESLGLSEREAVEYVLMLSREEAEARRRDGLQETEPAQQEEEGIFDVDLDDGPSYAPRYAQPPVSRPSRTPSSTASLSPPLQPTASSPAASSLSRSHPRVLADACILPYAVALRAANRDHPVHVAAAPQVRRSHAVSSDQQGDGPMAAHVRRGREMRHPARVVGGRGL
ncbi:hypothetical protein EWM64_g551 [Hericium alpestre]|uniref:Uncharacterized protein n=1 Tax=Hericium alpestre TaxID=135208 RepID=A0A4Z0A9S6_9AGAM|nr:hypothetical protein EWM64_g551 [Hericium alpestre]